MTHQSIITPDLGEKVLHTLERYARLPTHGFVAGQAVASAIDEVLGTAKPVYNDIDVFLDFDNWGSHWPEDIERHAVRMADSTPGFDLGFKDCKLFANRVHYVDMPELFSDGYERKLSVAQRQLYSIGQTRIEGVVNFVRVDWSESVTAEARTMAEQPRELAQRQMHWLTKVFDMNSTQAAVDLHSGQLFATPQFEQYLRSRQLQVVTGFTPVHSLLRYLKKLGELKAYGNTDMHLRLVRKLVEMAQGDAAVTEVRRRGFRQGHIGLRDEDVKEECERRHCPNTYYAGWSRVGSGYRGEPLSFGRKYYEQYVKHQKLLNPHFMLTRHPRKDLWLLTSKTAVHDNGGFATYETPMVVATNFAHASLQPSKVTLARRAGLEELAAAFPADQQYWRSTLRFSFANGGPAYSEGMEDANLRKLWLEVMTEHEEFYWPVIALPFSKQIALIRKMRAAFNKLGMGQPWGALMRYDSNDALRLLEDEAYWKEFMDKHVGSLEPLCTPLPLPNTVDGIGVRELTSSRVLIDEGLSQHHCVGGYAEEVSQGSSRIVAFGTSRASKDRSTAEWRIRIGYAQVADGELAPVTEVRFELGQHRAAFNKRPPENFEKAEEQLREQMNQWAKAHLDEAIACIGAQPKVHQGGKLNFLDLDGDVPF